MNVNFHAKFTKGNSYALVMEDYGGISLQGYVKTNRLEITDILLIALQITDIFNGDAAG
ncbi:hypothetical protein WKK05_37680 (plasmid) [Nostoc sp. UHCC 0302]|uniref:hypothetical protein n=1 Tax=Nostoc sp. UHCC 0302 TaxID=3134896 RepID=UPI00311CBCB3